MAYSLAHAESLSKHVKYFGRGQRKSLFAGCSRFGTFLERECGLLQVAVFAPGVYELKEYTISWTYPELRSLHDTRHGSPFWLTVEDSVPAPGQLNLL